MRGLLKGMPVCWVEGWSVKPSCAGGFKLASWI